MTKWKQMDNTPLPEAKKHGRLISHSEIECAKCMKRYEFERILKIKTPPSRSLLMGSFFDAMCEGDHEACAEMSGTGQLSQEDCDLVADRYNKYKHHIDYDNDIQQMLVWAPVSESAFLAECENGYRPERIYLHGWLDRVVRHVESSGHPDHSSNHYVIDTIIDHKFTLKKLKPARIKKDGTPSYSPKGSWKDQGVRYIWMLQQMGHTHIKSIQFDVMNAEDDELIQIVYKPKQATIDAVPQGVLEAYEKIQRADYSPNVDWHCKWGDGPEDQCDYYDMCPAQQALAKAREKQEEIMTDYTNGYDPDLDG